MIMTRPRAVVSSVLISVLALVVLGACSSRSGYSASAAVRIQELTAEGSPAAATHLTAVLDNCKTTDPHPYTVHVQESAAQVRVRVRGPVWQGGDQAACANLVQVRLAGPLGRRAVVDAATGQSVAVRQVGG